MLVAFALCLGAVAIAARRWLPMDALPPQLSLALGWLDKVTARGDPSSYGQVRTGDAATSAVESPRQEGDAVAMPWEERETTYGEMPVHSQPAHR